MFGNGVSESTQVELDYLPEADTDFIVASIGEALGFIIIFLIILIYMNLFYWLLDYAYRTRNIFNSLIIIGFSSMLFFNCIISLGMVVAIAPVTPEQSAPMIAKTPFDTCLLYTSPSPRDS